MSAPESIAAQLTRRLTGLGLLGGVAMTLLLAIDFDHLFRESHLVISLRDELREISFYVMFPIVALTIAMILVCRWIIRRSFSAFEEAAKVVDAVSGSERAFRLDISQVPTEMSAGAHAINNLLGRLDDLAEKRENFAAQVAHELKTPMAILLLELDRLGTAESFRLKADVQRMSRLLDQLLLMAQLESYSASPMPAQLVSLADIAVEVVQNRAPHALSLGRHLAIQIADDCPMIGRREALVAALRNLIENALRVTPPRGVVTVTVGPGHKIGVRDGGPGLTHDELEALTKPFARAGHASDEGAGLGLAIVAQVARFHGGRIATDPQNRELQMFFP